ncbi:unnamed protein product [Linum tenue]|uniref:Uncharacterized protein n=1 Tax=Linum tenue TaxID=586396 RepID=A0AAV0GP72_9ROSI|nr:unnamed protein product [Linum tenue]
MAHLARRPAGKLMEVVVKSVENIKPASSSSGFEIRKPYNLCLLDQLMSSIYTSFVFFYPASSAANSHGPASPPADQLKASLSKTLNPFYPLAGRVRDNLVIDNFQAGVPISEARVAGRTLSEFLSPPDLDLLGELVPFEPLCVLQTPSTEFDDHPQLAVQASTFDCGGTAIGLNFHHKIADGGTITAFLENWAANDKKIGGSKSNHEQLPDLNRASSVFPPRRSIPPRIASFNAELLFQNLRRTATRRFVFGGEAIAALRGRARGIGLENPSRTETLWAFLWESAIRASQNEEQLQCFANIVSIRNRMGRRLCRNTIGNMFATPIAFRSEGRGGGKQRETMKELAEVIRRSAQGVDEAYLDSISGEGGSEVMFDAMNRLAGRIGGSHEVLAGTSWLQFDLLRSFELAGLGKPVWVSMMGGARGDRRCVENCMILNELAGGEVAGGGMVEAWVRLDEEIMAGLERDPGFLEFASHNPAIVVT